jgi:hypothetical protein
MSTEYIAISPPTLEQVDLMVTISAISFILGLIAFICVIAVAVVVAYKTRLPGRRSVLVSLVLLSAWWGFEQFMGGSLEMTFGPVSQLVSDTVYALAALVFAFGYLRMCSSFFRQRAITSTEQ